MQQVPGDAGIRQVINEVFRSPEYSRSWRDVLWTNFLQLVDRFFAFIERTARENPFLFWTSLTVLGIVMLLVLSRGALLARARADLAARLGVGESGTTSLSSDAWRSAQQLAQQARYTEAAHALYRHLLQFLSRSEKIELHPAKTVGDYARELRTRSSARFARYREFGRTYEFVVYGEGECDRDRYERLLSLANAITGAHA